MKQPVIKLVLLLICCQAVCVLPASFLLTLCHPVWIGLHAQVGSGAAQVRCYVHMERSHPWKSGDWGQFHCNMYNIQEGEKHEIVFVFVIRYICKFLKFLKEKKIAQLQ